MDRGWSEITAKNPSMTCPGPSFRTWKCLEKDTGCGGLIKIGKREEKGITVEIEKKNSGIMMRKQQY